MSEIGIGVIGGGYMGKAHSVAMSAVGAVFGTTLRPRLEMIAATSTESAEHYRQSYGFKCATNDWRILVDDDRVEAVIIASPQATHREIAERALAAGKPVMCEKPMGASLVDSLAIVEAAEAAGVAGCVLAHSAAEGALVACACGADALPRPLVQAYACMPRPTLAVPNWACCCWCASFSPSRHMFPPRP